MKRHEIENLFQTLAMSQGLYGRLLDDIYSAPEDVRDEYWAYMEEQNFATPLDVIMFIEG